MRFSQIAQRLARFELGTVGSLVALGVIYSRLLPMALAGGALFWLARGLNRERLTAPTPADWPLALLVLMLPISIWVTPLPDLTLPQVYRLLAGMVLYYASINWTVTPARLRLLANGVIFMGLMLALSASFTVEWFSETKLLFIPEAIYRIVPLLASDPIHPNVMAGALTMLAPCALGLLTFGWTRLGRLERWLTLTGSVTMVIVLALCKSRGGLIGLAAALLVLIALRWRRGWLALPLAVLAYSLLAWQVGPTRLLDLLTLTRSIGGIEGRLEIWSRALYIIRDFPFTGIGMGTFRQVANGLYPFLLAGPNADINHAHNLFLQIAVDLGLPGLLAWLAIAATITLTAWPLYQRGKSLQENWLRGLGAGLLCSQTALLAHGLTDAVTWGTRPAMLVWLVWGLAIAARRIEDKKLCAVTCPPP